MANSGGRALTLSWQASLVNTMTWAMCVAVAQRFRSSGGSLQLPACCSISALFLRMLAR
jgi:hypothetical protein